MTARNSGSVTLRSVAKHSKVALQTASKSLNGDPTVRSYLRERVLKSAQTLGYRLNPLARAMATRSSKLVTLSVFELRNPFFGWLADTLTSELAKIGLSAVFCERTEHVVEFNTGFCAAGSILVCPTADDVNRIAANQPVVTIETQDQTGQVAPNVSLAIRDAYRELTTRALASGRRRVAFHCNPNGQDIHSKYRYVEELLREHGMDMVRLPEPAMISSLELADYLSHHPGIVDCIFCINDLEAAKVLTALSTKGIKVPDECLVIGCDGVISMPGVWTAISDVPQLASQAVSLLQAQLTGDRTKRNLQLPLELHTPGAILV
jgi:DNA-binding LacI/PurR family transcriptional regulator